jgi:hypothetical protein
MQLNYYKNHCAAGKIKKFAWHQFTAYVPNAKNLKNPIFSNTMYCGDYRRKVKRLAAIKALINRHVRKLFLNYDCSGLKENYIVVYASAQDFEGLCKKYREHLEHIDYESYTLMKDGIEEIHTVFNKIAAYRARHRCNKGETVLNHLLVAMAGSA